MLQISFTGTVQIQERQKVGEKIKVNELDGVRDLLQQHVQEQPFTNEVSNNTGHNLSNNYLICSKMYITIIINSFCAVLMISVSFFMENAYYFMFT